MVQQPHQQHAAGHHGTATASKAHSSASWYSKHITGMNQDIMIQQAHQQYAAGHHGTAATENDGASYPMDECEFQAAKIDSQLLFKIYIPFVLLLVLSYQPILFDS